MQNTTPVTIQELLAEEVALVAGAGGTHQPLAGAIDW